MKANIGKTSLILGWQTKFDSDRIANANKINRIMRKKSETDLSYAIHYKGDGHLVTFAPTGSGKGVGAIIPNLLHYSGPTIVIDPKGENFAVTAMYRKGLGQKILLLDPFHAIDDDLLRRYNVERGRLNPLDLCIVVDEAGAEDEAQMLASAFAGEGTLSKEPFWDLSAIKLVSGIIALEMDVSRRQNRKPKFSKIIDALYSDDVTYNLAVMLDTLKPSDFVVKTIGSFLQVSAEQTRIGMLTTAQSYFTTFINKNITSSLEDSTINLKDIQDKEDYTLYIVIPPNKLKSHSALLKTWIATLMHTVMERKQLPKKRTLFILDECANLGELDTLRKAVTLLRGYGLQVWMFFQDLSQISTLYPLDYRTMINNCGVLQAFGLGRLSAASPLAEIIGQYKDSEILNLDSNQQILSIAPGKVKIARLLKYYQDIPFEGRYQTNPLINNQQNNNFFNVKNFAKRNLRTKTRF